MDQVNSYSMESIYYLFLKDANNIGDWASSPYHYIDPVEGYNQVAMDIREYCKNSPKDYHHVIIGGGGLIYPGLTELLKFVLDHCKGKKVIWGIGQNYHHGIHDEYKKNPYPEWLNKFDLVGLRDKDAGHDFEWVLDASCLLAQVYKDFELKNNILIYCHKDISIKNIQHESEKMYMFYNVGSTRTELSKALSYISSSKCVITNSYHGAYWSLLFDKILVLWKPFSTRFNYLGFNLIYSDENNWEFNKENFKKECDTSNFLNECLESNKSFEKKVRELFKK